MNEFDKVFNKDKSLMEAIEERDTKLVRKIMDKAEKGEIVRIT